MDEKTFELVKQALGDEHACYVLVSCKVPDKEGKMEVALNYEGDKDLASYLLESAQQVFVQQRDNSEQA